MMDTTTRKAEALSLLALDKMTRAQEIELNILTAQEAGYRAIDAGWGRNLSGDDWRWGYLVTPAGERVTPEYEEKHYKMDDVWLMESPEFCTSVDACLLLPLPRRHYWQLFSRTESVDLDWYSAEICDAMGAPADDNKTAGTLPLAMLAAWWSMQD